MVVSARSVNSITGSDANPKIKNTCFLKLSLHNLFPTKTTVTDSIIGRWIQNFLVLVC